MLGIGGGIALHAAVLRVALLVVLRYFSACCSAACVTAGSFALVPKKRKLPSLRGAAAVLVGCKVGAVVCGSIEKW